MFNIINQWNILLSTITILISIYTLTIPVHNFNYYFTISTHPFVYILNIITTYIPKDTNLDILDIVIMISTILNNEYSLIADVNEDGSVDILDVVMMANILVGGLP